MADENDNADDGLDELLDTEGADTLPAGGTAGADDKDELRLAMADLAKSVTTLATPKKDEPKELTQEQKDELWGVFNPEKDDPKFLDKFFRLADDMTPEQKLEYKKLFGALQQGLVRQSVVGARNLFQMELQKLQEELQPVREFVTEQRAERTRTKFYSSYPALDEKTEAGGRRYEKIINATARELEKGTFDSEEAYFKALAEGAAEKITTVLPTFVLGAKPKPTKPAGSTPRLPRTSAGGTGGAGNAPSGGVHAKGDATDEFLDD